MPKNYNYSAGNKLLITLLKQTTIFKMCVIQILLKYVIIFSQINLM